MNQQNIILESSPAYALLCLALAIGFAFLLYRGRHPWSKFWNNILLGVRTLLLFLLMFLLLGPIVKQINNIFEKPLFVLMFDNSISVKESVDSLSLRNVQQQLSQTKEALEENGFDVKLTDLSGEEVEQINFSADKTDLNGALKKISNQYEGRKVTGVVLASDGIYNTGVSPLFITYNFPVYSVGVGDTTVHTDAGIKNIAYNKIAYEGNKFPIRVELLTKNLQDQSLKVSLLHRGKIIEQQTKKVKGDELVTFDFQPLASEQGMQKLDISVEPVQGETNVRNNRSSVFVEVVEGKKKILVIAPAPHPDIKALREVISKNSNYDFLLHIPGVNELQPADMQPEKVDLVILYQAPDVRGKTRELYQKFVNSKTSLFFVLGQQSDLRFLGQQSIPIKYETMPREFDEVTPSVNTGFSNFTISPEATSLMSGYPPVSVYFGKMKIALSVSPILFQRVGNVSTEKPLLAIDVQDNRKTAVMMGEGFWRWRLNEFDKTENTVAFDELFGKLIQFLSTTEDKRKFRSYPTRQEFSDAEPVIFESQVYNDIYEPVYGNTINIDLTNEAGNKTSYSYVTSTGNIRYQVGGLKEGVYRYRSHTTINQKTEEVRGEFAIVAREAELQNLTADFDLLKKLSANTGGKFYNASEANVLNADLQKLQAQHVIHSEETYDSLINLKAVFWLLIVFISLEWFVRKYYGSY